MGGIVLLLHGMQAANQDDASDAVRHDRQPVEQTAGEVGCGSEEGEVLQERLRDRTQQRR
jgi:hypothetical protein